MIFYLDKMQPKGTVVEEVGRALVQQGHYKLKILNTIDFGCSMHYNPFHYLHSETDILSLVTVIMENTQSKEGKGGDDFWSKAEALLYQALIAYIYYEAPEEEKNMTTLLDILYAQPIADVMAAMITVFMALHLHKELSMVERNLFLKGNK